VLYLVLVSAISQALMWLGASAPVTTDVRDA